MEDFLFGVATAATQIEGGYNQDGKSLSVWDEYSVKGLIKNKHTCFTACDCYNRLDEDLAIIKELGINAYRFSINWTRIQPHGKGPVNQKGIDYYNRLIDGLLAIGVKPVVTLFHWDLPVEFLEFGDFANREIIARFEEYGKIVAENFGNRVDMFVTFNEAAVVLDFLYERPVGGGYTPRSKKELVVALHNLLMCNAAMTYSLRKYSKLPVKVGMTNVSYIRVPKEPWMEDKIKEATFKPGNKFYESNTTYLDPIIFGKYNEELIKKFDLDLSFVQEGDMEYINCGFDFIGMNIYCGKMSEVNEKGEVVDTLPSVNAALGNAGGDFIGTASVMYYGPKFMSERYGLPVYVMETGVAVTEWKCLDGTINDSMRADYIERYVSTAVQARKDGVDIRGCFVWSLMDNFEWSSGYTLRFGIVYVDFETLERIKKLSFYKYKELIEKLKDK